jgi:hypothetical protein
MIPAAVPPLTATHFHQVPQWLRKRLGPHWFDRIVSVSFNHYPNQKRALRHRFAEIVPQLGNLRSLQSITFLGGTLETDDYRISARWASPIRELPMRESRRSPIAGFDSLDLRATTQLQLELRATT